MRNSLLLTLVDIAPSRVGDGSRDSAGHRTATESILERCERRSGLSIGREVLGCGLGRHRADYSPREEDPSMLDLGLNGKVAIITGGSEGLGRAAAEKLAAEGVRVAICARRREHRDGGAREWRETARGHALAQRADDIRGAQREGLRNDVLAQ